MNRPRPLSIQSLPFTYRHALQRIPRRRLIQTEAKPSAKPPKARRFRAARIWYGLVFAGGLALGFAVKDFVGTSPWPAPGTEEDALYLNACAKEIDDLEVVKYMRSQCRPRADAKEESETSATAPTVEESAETANGEQKDWVELDIKNNIVESEHDCRVVILACCG